MTTQVSDALVRLDGVWLRPLEPIEVRCVDPWAGQQVAVIAGGGAAGADAAVRSGWVVDPDGEVIDADHELFGPVLPIRRYRDVDAVIRRAAMQRTGLGGYVFGTDLADAARVASQLDVGIVGVNTTLNVPSVPFAGRRGSGLGIEGAAAGMAELLRPQTVAVAVDG